MEYIEGLEGQKRRRGKENRQGGTFEGEEEKRKGDSKKRRYSKRIGKRTRKREEGA